MYKWLDIIGISFQLFAGLLLALDQISQYQVNAIAKKINLWLIIIGSKRIIFLTSLIIAIVALLIFGLILGITNYNISNLDSIIATTLGILTLFSFTGLIYLQSMNVIAYIFTKTEVRMRLVKNIRDIQVIGILKTKLDTAFKNSAYKLAINVIGLMIGILLALLTLFLSYLLSLIQIENYLLLIVTRVILVLMLVILFSTSLALIISCTFYTLTTLVLIGISSLRSMTRRQFWYTILIIWLIGGTCLLVNMILRPD